MQPDLDLCYGLLPKVSRTFSLNIRILPGRLRPAVTVAYLLFRYADTIEDAPRLSGEDRTELFEAFLDRLDGTVPLRQPEGPLIRLVDAIPPEELELVEAIERVFLAFEALPETTRRIIASHVSETARGMERILRTKMDDGLLTLDTWQDLDEYCYYVAGTIGIMLTRLFAEHSRHLEPESVRRLTALGTNFGRGLQLTNVLKGIGVDHREGRCFLPRAELAEHAVRPADLLAPYSRAGLTEVARAIIPRAVQDLEDALRYTTLLPRREPRLRLFCLWPLFAAVRTLDLVASGDGLADPVRQPRISRSVLYREMALSVIQVGSNGGLRKRFERFRSRLFPDATRREVWAG
jgi:farnesyl-diphosphate farnesyltransferase